MTQVAIFGAGRVGKALLNILEKQQWKIILVESDNNTCEALAAESNATVINGDATNPEVLDSLKLKEMDYVFAVTGSEEANFLISVYAKDVGAKNIISRVTEVKHSLIFERLGILPVVPEYVLAREIANRVSSPVIYKLLDPTVSDIELVERFVEKKHVGKKLKDINVGNSSAVVALFFDGKFIIPKPDVEIMEGMKMVLVKEG
ncbi:NAD-binding protein [Candidatus Micrarchaeota archaeon]|nr:NAD-binding protein [Candidatus Micrarchaeota archaeon]